MRALLKTSGLFFFTCPTQQDGKHGYGEQIAPHTYRSTKSITPGDIHYFANESDLDKLLFGFRQLSRRRDEGHWDNAGVQQFTQTGELWLRNCSGQAVVELIAAGDDEELNWLIFGHLMG